MKGFVVLAVVIELCFGNAIPLTPGDNSHYVEGVSRYIWMPDGEGIPWLVDLQEELDFDILRKRDGSNNQYWLYTRSNNDTAQIITHGDEDSISSSNYNSSKPLKVVVHGWNNNGNSDVNNLVKTAFLAVLDANVIVVDWRSLASSNYITATYGVPSVGEHLGNFLIWLISTAGGDWNNVHLVGHSLGAHVVGNAGRTVGGLAARVTGMDPAGPLWRGNENALNSSSAVYVEAIHTDAGILGIPDAVGHVDFFPNEGDNPQPGCFLSTCSHSRSYQLFASTVHTNHLSGYLCENLAAARSGNCSGDTLNMGNSDITKQGSGIYWLTTGSEWPY